MNVPADAPNPLLTARAREQMIAAVSRYRVHLLNEVRRVDDLLASLGARPSRPPRRTDHERNPDGTYALLRRYYRTHPDQDLRAQPAAEWMLAHGWQTTARDPARAAIMAMGQMASPNWKGGPELVRVDTGTYRVIGQEGGRSDGLPSG